MANIVTIVLDGKDNTGGMFASVSGNTKTLTSNMKAGGIAFQQFGNVAEQLGSGPLANIANQLHNTVSATRLLTQELGKSKLAMAALGTVAFAGGVGLAGPIYDFFNGDAVKKADDNAKALAIQYKASFALLNEFNAREQAITDSIKAQKLAVDALIISQER